MATTSPRLEAAQTFLSAFATLSASTSNSVRTANCIHLFGPSSVAPPPPLTNAAFAEHFSHFDGILKGFPVTAKEIVDNPTANQVTVWATSEVIWDEDVKDLDGIEEEEWVYRGEYIFILDFEEDERGEQKISRIVEFLDSKGTERLRILMARARANRMKNDEAGKK